MTENTSELSKHWQLDPGMTFLNHGSFGACPTVLLEKQRAIQDRLEREPVAFFMREFEGLMDEARDALGKFLNADSADLALIPNATAG
ncbi:MAG: aminotransferase, partial [Planctomycetota bacterium]|nr:aminotransferase [Planctomycetota bacterium]